MTAGDELTRLVDQSPSFQPSDEELAQLLDDIVACLRRFIILSPAQQAVIALWVLHTHAIAATDTTAYLHFSSGEPGSGKSRSLEVVRELVREPLPTANISEAAFYRAIEEKKPTLLHDEIDAVFGPKARDHEDLRGLINDGWRRGNCVYRMGGKNKDELMPFEVFCPKAFAGLGQLPQTVADRCIQIRLKKKRPDEKIDRGRIRHIAEATGSLRSRTEEWASRAVARLEDAEPELPDELDGRKQDLVELMVAIADMAGGDWPHRSRRAVMELVGAQPTEDRSHRVQLLADIHEIHGERDPDEKWIQSAELVELLCQREESPWAEWHHGKGLTQRGLKKLLDELDVGDTEAHDFPNGRKRGYRWAQFDDAITRHLGVVACLRDEPLWNGESGAESDHVTASAGAEITQPSHNEASADHAITQEAPSSRNGANGHSETVELFADEEAEAEAARVIAKFGGEL